MVATSSHKHLAIQNLLNTAPLPVTDICGPLCTVVELTTVTFSGVNVTTHLVQGQSSPAHTCPQGQGDYGDPPV